MAKKNNCLIISVNPNPLCIATEINLVRNKKNEGIVSGVNLNALVKNVHLKETLRDKIYELIDRKYSKFICPELNGIDYTKIIKINEFCIPAIPRTIDQVRKYKIDDVSIGLAALSSAASLACCTSEYTIDYGVIFRKAWLIAHRSYFAGLAIANLDIDEICIFNGRHAISRPITEVLRRKCRVTYYEFGNKETGYLLFDTSVHSLEMQATRINNHVPVHHAGNNFFAENINRKQGTESFRYTAQQKVGLLPELDEGMDVISFFTSSPDELFASSDSNCLSQDFENQFEVAYFAASKCKEIEKQLVIRLHPHLKRKHISWMNEWDFKLLENLGVTIIYPDEKYDSYALLMKSTAVITCGSSIGIEAAYHGIPNGDVGDSINSRIGCGMDISSKLDFLNFLTSPALPENAKEQAIRYGSYVSTTAGKEITGLIKYGDTYLFENRVISPTQLLISRLKKMFSHIANLFVVVAT